MSATAGAWIGLAVLVLALPRAGAQEVPLTEADLAAMGGQAAPADTSTAPLSAAELAELGVTESAPAVDKSLNFSGFADFTLGSMVGDKSSAWRSFNVAPSHASFYLGNVNLYLSKFLTEKLFTLGEVRFSYLPNGSTRFGVEERTSTEAYDYSDFGRVMRWGGIEIERFVLDWIAHPRITVRIGQFLTPYGVWNVDHGSPTYIPPRRPWIIGAGWFPERQTGIELFGRYDLTAWGTLGYHLTISNGTGPVSEYADLDDNKAVGGRLYWDYRRFGRLLVGVSGYYGRETATTVGIQADAQGAYKSSEHITTQHDVLTFAGDLRWTYGGWHAQAEALVYQRAYTTEGRTSQTLPIAVGSLPSDRVSWGTYALLGYRFQWLGVMPFLIYERARGDLYFTALDLHTIQGGLNIRPVEVLTLKFSYENVFSNNAEIIGGAPLRQLQGQVAWAF